MNRQQKAIEAVVSRFNFEKVQRAMVALGWRWGSAKNGIPELDELQKVARSLLANAIDLKSRESNSASASSGGFVATVDTDSISLLFKIDEKTVFFDDVEHG